MLKVSIKKSNAATFLVAALVPLSSIDCSKNAYSHGDTYGKSAMVRDFLICPVRLRWCNAQLPDMRDARILPRSVKKLRKNPAFL